MKLANNESSLRVTTFGAGEDFPRGVFEVVSGKSMSRVDDGNCVDHKGYILMPVSVS